VFYISTHKTKEAKGKSFLLILQLTVKKGRKGKENGVGGQKEEWLTFAAGHPKIVHF